VEPKNRHLFSDGIDELACSLILGFVLFDVPQAPKNIAEKVIANMKKKYEGKPVFYITEPCNGTRVLTIPK
jgi:hypothetical protein